MEKQNCKNCKHKCKNRFATKDLKYVCAYLPLIPFNNDPENCSLFSPNLYTKTKRLVKSILTAIGCTTYDEPEKYLED